MPQLRVKATAEVTTDKGIFEAVISTSSVDRDGDVVVPAAMVSALRGWATTGKAIPLAWNHSSNPEDLIGSVDPGSVFESGGEVIATGQVDLDTERGRHVWRLMKSGTLGFSFGYLSTASTPRDGGGRNINALDVFEVSACPIPANPATRVLAVKAYDDGRIADAIRHRQLELLIAEARAGLR